MNTALFVGGGSIGHIAPAAAVARALQKKHEDCKIHFVCSQREDDAVFLANEGFEHRTQINAPRPGLRFLWRFWQAYKQSRQLLKIMNPTVVFSKGGYVSVPVCLAAKRCGIPIVLHESDAVNGYANRLVARWAAHVCTSFPHTATSGGPDRRRRTCTGNPVRSAITQGSAREGLRLTKFEGRKPVLLVIGGSQGAQALNEYVAGNIEELLSAFNIIHITGPGKSGVPGMEKGYWCTDFAGAELPHLYAITDIAVSRAGANTIAELAANTIPTILVPLRGVAHDHQQKNAQAVQQIGGCIVVQQKKMERELFSVLRHMNEQDSLRKGLSQALHTFHKPDAAVQIAKIISGYLA